MNALQPTFACPRCSILVVDERGALICPRCETELGPRDGIYRCVLPERLRELQPFFRQYRVVREKDGYRARAAEYYQALPYVTADDPHAASWRVRQESYERLRRQVLSRSNGDALAVLDLGAGNGWLSHRLGTLGHRPVAVDVFDDDEDGLGACQHYDISFPCVQADFDALPFAPGQFDRVVFNGSLHYSPDVRATLQRARHMLRPGGALLVIDSPMFRTDADGRAMLARQARSFRTEYGLSVLAPHGVGYLTLAGLIDAATALNLECRFFPSRGGLVWAARRFVGRVKTRQTPAAFGVWVAQS